MWKERLLGIIFRICTEVHINPISKFWTKFSTVSHAFLQNNFINGQIRISIIQPRVHGWCHRIMKLRSSNTGQTSKLSKSCLFLWTWRRSIELTWIFIILIMRVPLHDHILLPFTIHLWVVDWLPNSFYFTHTFCSLHPLDSFWDFRFCLDINLDLRSFHLFLGWFWWFWVRGFLDTVGWCDNLFWGVLVGWSDWTMVLAFGLWIWSWFVNCAVEFGWIYSETILSRGGAMLIDIKSKIVTNFFVCVGILWV